MQIKVSAYTSLILALLCFYVMISTIKEIKFGEIAKASPDINFIPVYLTYAMNSALAAAASFAFLITLINAITALAYTQCYDDTRVSCFMRIYSNLTNI
jgi:uncharacterized membrane protein